MSASSPLRERLLALPKTELHLHAMGAMRPSTVVELARGKGAPILAAAERMAGDGFRFANLSEFIDFFVGLFPLVTRPEEFERVAYEVLSDAAALGVRWVEPRWTPTSHLSRGATVDGMFAGIEAGRKAAERDHGIGARWIVDFPRGLGLENAEQATGIAVATKDRGTAALDVAGDERRVAADPAFAPLFARARRAGLVPLAHAGEGAGPESVRGALDLYGAARIGHGTRSVEDEALVARLARERVLLEVCPTSNVRLRVVQDVASHPVTRFLAAGVPVAVCSDDPTLFATDVVSEMERLHVEARVPLATLGRLAAESFDHALLPESERRDRFADARREALAWAEAAEAVA